MSVIYGTHVRLVGSAESDSTDFSATNGGRSVVKYYYNYFGMSTRGPTYPVSPDFFPYELMDMPLDANSRIGIQSLSISGGDARSDMKIGFELEIHPNDETQSPSVHEIHEIDFAAVNDRLTLTRGSETINHYHIDSTYNLSEVVTDYNPAETKYIIPRLQLKSTANFNSRVTCVIVLNGPLR